MMNGLPANVRGWYDLSKQSGTDFFGALQHLGPDRLIELLEAEQGGPAPGRPRTLDEVRSLQAARTDLPPVDDLKLRRSDEYTLQCMFAHRGYFAHPAERVVLRELPTGRAGEFRQGWADLLVCDGSGAVARIVELKDGDANDSLCGAVLEALSHWVFHRRYGVDEFTGGVRCRLEAAIAAPSAYFRRVTAKKRRPRGEESQRALEWIRVLKVRGTVAIGLYQISDEWMEEGPKFEMAPVERGYVSG